MNKKFLFILATLIILLFSLHFIFLRIDYLRVKSGKEPIFSVLAYQVTDGGSKGYLGLGYQLEYKHSMSGPELKNGEVIIKGYYVGLKVNGLPGLSILDNMIAKSIAVKFIAN